MRSASSPISHQTDLGPGFVSVYNTIKNGSHYTPVKLFASGVNAECFRSSDLWPHCWFDFVLHGLEDHGSKSGSSYPVSIVNHNLGFKNDKSLTFSPLASH